MHTNVNFGFQSTIGFLSMLQVCDSYFPIGAFTLSNGLETYIQKDLITDVDGLNKYLKAFLTVFPYNDLAFMSCSRKFADENDINSISELDLLCSASKTPKEVRQGSIKTCVRFIKAQEYIKSSIILSEYKKMIDEKKCEGHYCIALGIFTKEKSIDLKLAMTMYTYTTLSAIVNNAAKMIPLSQMAGQKALNKVLCEIPDVIEKAITTDYYELGISGVGFDIRASQHEHLYSRLYMS